MANTKPSPSIWNYLALAFVLAFFGMMLVATIWNVVEGLGALRYGSFIYFFGLFALALGFMTKEDNVAIGSIVGLSLLVMLDVALNIGTLIHW